MLSLWSSYKDLSDLVVSHCLLNSFVKIVQIKAWQICSHRCWTLVLQGYVFNSFALEIYMCLTNRSEKANYSTCSSKKSLLRNGTLCSFIVCDLWLVAQCFSSSIFATFAAPNKTVPELNREEIHYEVLNLICHLFQSKNKNWNYEIIRTNYPLKALTKKNIWRCISMKDVYI